MNIDQQKYNKAMQEITNAYNSAFCAREYLIRLADEVRDNPERRKQVEQWQGTAAYATNVVHDAKGTLSHAYDVMLKWEREDEDKKYRDKKEE